MYDVSEIDFLLFSSIFYCFSIKKKKVDILL